MKWSKLIFFLLVSFLVIHASAVWPDDVKNPRFIRILAELSANRIKIVDAKIHTGVVTSRKTPVFERNDPYLFRIYNVEEKGLFEDTFTDPRVVHYDALDSAGNLTGGIVNLEKAAFSIKFPYIEEADRVEFFERRVRLADEGTVSAASEQRIGSFSLREVRNAAQR